MSDFTLGCDPEVFVAGPNGFVCADGIGITGTKKSPQPVAGGAVQVDGMALEFNTDPLVIDPGSACGAAAFDERTMAVLEQLGGMIPAEYTLQPISYAEFEPSVWDSAPERAKELGCDPDFNAYEGGAMNKSPDRGGRLFSTGAGHLHIGFVEPGYEIDPRSPLHMKLCCEIAKMMDIFVGQYMVLIEENGVRRELYGKAGAFRPKSYGVEYRTPSNEWLTTPERRQMIYKLVGAAVYAIQMGWTAAQLDWRAEARDNIDNRASRVVARQLLLDATGKIGLHTLAEEIAERY